MIILNVNFKLVSTHDETSHQLSLCNPQRINETIIVHGFSIEEINNYFCYGKGFRVIPEGSIRLNTETWTFHVTKEDDGNIYIIFNEYLHIHLRGRNESKISLKHPIKILEAKGNNNSYKDIVKYFCIPKEMKFWIKEYKGENLICYYWDGQEFKNVGNKDMQEFDASDKVIKNIIPVTSEKNLFITDGTCNIEMFLRTYPNMFFRFLYEDFLNNIEEKYKDFHRTIIVEIDRDSDVREQILKKAKKRLPLYVCIPTYDYNSYYAVYEAIEIK